MSKQHLELVDPEQLLNYKGEVVISGGKYYLSGIGCLESKGYDPCADGSVRLSKSTTA